LSDINYRGFIIDGSMNLPQLNLIPKKTYFDPSDSVEFSQLNILQDHRTHFYDTSISLNKNYNNNLEIFTQFEAKSFDKQSFNQKGLFIVNKKTNNFLIDFGYFYGFDSRNIFVSDDLNLYNDNFVSSELYNMMINIDYSNNNFEINNSINSQFSHYSRYIYNDYFAENNEAEYRFPLNYDSQTLWHSACIKYNLNKKYKIIFDINSKSSNSERKEQSIFYGYYHNINLGLSYNFLNHSIYFGANNLDKEFDYKLVYSYKINEMLELNLTKENIPYIYISNIEYDDQIIPEIRRDKMIFEYSKNKKIKLNFINEFLYADFVFGHNVISDKSYYYYNIAGAANYDYFSLLFNSSSYSSNLLLINSSNKIGLKISPIIPNVKYRVYFNICLNSINLNNHYIFKQDYLSFYKISKNLSSELNINVIDTEIGFLFKYFKISFIKENMFDESNDYYYSYNEHAIQNDYKITSRNISNYLVNIIWLFKD